MKIRVGVVGISGYVGLELVKLILQHPEIELAAAMDAAETGEKPVDEIHPRLRGACKLSTFQPDKDRMAELKLDTVFLCTPDKVSYELVPKILSAGIRVIDLSGSYRLKDTASYSSWYGFHHANDNLLKSAVYGLSEWNAKAIASASLIANPGCYPTSVTLAPSDSRRNDRDRLRYFLRFKIRSYGRRPWSEAGAHVLRGDGKFPPVQSHYAPACSGNVSGTGMGPEQFHLRSAPFADQSRDYFDDVCAIAPAAQFGRNRSGV
jgi:hypothetical protein